MALNEKQYEYLLKKRSLEIQKRHTSIKRLANVFTLSTLVIGLVLFFKGHLLLGLIPIFLWGLFNGFCGLMFEFIPDIRGIRPLTGNLARWFGGFVFIISLISTLLLLKFISIVYY